MTIYKILSHNVCMRVFHTEAREADQPPVPLPLRLREKNRAQSPSPAAPDNINGDAGHAWLIWRPSRQTETCVGT